MEDWSWEAGSVYWQAAAQVHSAAGQTSSTHQQKTAKVESLEEMVGKWKCLNSWHELYYVRL